MFKHIQLLTCALCAILVIPAAAQVPAYVPTDGLVGWWPFNGNANDESGNGNDGVVNGATLTEDRNEISNSAYNFNGNGQKIVIPASNSISNINIEASFSAWALSENGISYVLCKSNSQSGEYRIICFDSNFRIVVNGNEYDVAYNFPIQQWFHLAATFLNGQLTLYINGETISSTNSIYGPYPQINTTTNLEFGSDPWGLTEYHQGSLDDIAIYNRALTEQEIQNLYTGTTPPPCVSLPSNLQQGLVGYWPFCGNANDESGNGNDGVVNGATLTEDRFGNAGKAYSFDGNTNHIEIQDNPDLELLNTDFTINAWVNPQDENGNHIYYKGASTGNNFPKYLFRWNQNQFAFHVNGNGLGQGLWAYSDITQSTSWQMGTIVKEGNMYNFYIDGVAAGSSTIDQPIQSTIGHNVRIGGAEPNGGGGWLGSLDDIGIWNRALTPEEVQELYTLDACTFTVYDTLTVYETVYDTVYTYETIYDTVTTYVTVTDTLLIDITFVGFEGQPSWLNTVTIFPNPASDHITIDYGNFALMAGYNTIITDAAGATVYSSAVNSQQVSIDINAWGATGVYYMSVYDASGQLVAVRHIVLE